jgi:hemerythrin-like domain-containing protein
MTQHQTMNTVIHAAFRRDIGRFDDALAAFPTDSQQRADDLVRAWDNFAFQLHHHHEDEETIFFPAFRALGADDSLLGDMDGEHQRMAQALTVAETAMANLRSSPSAANAGAAGTAITELGSVMNVHLEHEERDLEPFAVQHKGSPEVKHAGVAVRKAHQGVMGTFITWLLDGADADAVTGLRHEIPPPALFVLTRIPGRHYNRDIASVWR